jgi:hypothetical protein
MIRWFLVVVGIGHREGWEKDDLKEEVFRMKK